MSTPGLLELRLQAQEHVRALALGLHPKTREKLVDPAALGDADVVRSLFVALEALHSVLEVGDGGQMADRAGKPWSAAEDRELRTAFHNGAELEEIATDHRRRSGGILSRLVRLEAVASRDEARSIFGQRRREI